MSFVTHWEKKANMSEKCWRRGWAQKTWLNFQRILPKDATLGAFPLQNTFIMTPGLQGGFSYTITTPWAVKLTLLTEYCFCFFLNKCVPFSSWRLLTYIEWLNHIVLCHIKETPLFPLLFCWVSDIQWSSFQIIKIIPCKYNSVSQSVLPWLLIFYLYLCFLFYCGHLPLVWLSTPPQYVAPVSHCLLIIHVSTFFFDYTFELFFAWHLLCGSIYMCA